MCSAHFLWKKVGQKKMQPVRAICPLHEEHTLRTRVLLLGRGVHTVEKRGAVV